MFNPNAGMKFAYTTFSKIPSELQTGKCYVWQDLRLGEMRKDCNSQCASGKALIYFLKKTSAQIPLSHSNSHI